MRRYLRFSLRTLFILTTLAAIACLWLPRYTGKRVTEASFERVHCGMTVAVVQSILGWGRKPPVASQDAKCLTADSEVVKVLEWSDGSTTILVGFDSNGKAVTTMLSLEMVQAQYPPAP